MNDATRTALVDELAEAMNTANNTLFANGGHGDITEDDEGAATLLRRLAPACLPIIDRLLADRAVPEPDADDVERAANAICDVDMSMFPDYVRHIPARTIYLDRARAAIAAVPTVQAAAERTYTLADMMREYQRGFRDSEAITEQFAAGDDLDADMTLAYMKGWQDGQDAMRKSVVAAVAKAKESTS